MTLLAAHYLWLLLLLGAAVAAYVFLQSRRRHYAVTFTNLELLASVAPRRPGWRRHMAAAALALSAAALIIGLARPVVALRVPKDTATVMLVIDASASMDASDVAPSRIQAATDAAKQFLAELPDRFRVGLVAFDRSPRLVAPPTDDKQLVRSALDALQIGPGTATGEAVFVALEAIDSPLGAAGPRENPGAIVLLSDGVTTVGRPVEVAAAAAADAKVPISTIAFGTPNGTVDVNGREVPVPSDPQTMASVAETTSGQFFEAVTGEELRSVYADIGSRIGYETEQREIGMRFVGLGTILLFAGAALSLIWSGRLL